MAKSSINDAAEACNAAPTLNCNALADASLLLKLARERNQQAFAELYRRMERKALSLARAITNNHLLAEEAVQEAFCRVWVYASNFRQGGNVRGWILQIVARESLKKIRTLRKETRERERWEAASDRKEEPADASGEHHELRARLHAALAELPPDSLRLLGLHYGAGLTMSQISKALQVPNRTVYRQLEAALTGLRERLNGAGGQAATGWSLEGILGVALLEGASPSPELWPRILAQATQNLPAQANAAHWIAGRPWTLGLLAALALGSAATAFLATPPAPAAPGRSSTHPAPESAPGGNPAATAPPLTPANPKDPFARLPRPPLRWDFEKEHSLEAEVVHGSWTRGRLERYPGYGIAVDNPAGTASLLLLPVRLPAEPHLVTIKFRPLGFQDHKSGISWCRDDLLLAPRTLHEARAGCAIQKENTLCCYLFQDRIAFVTNGMLTRCQVYPKPYPGDRLVLWAHLAFFDEIAVRAVRFEEIPLECRLDSTFQTPAFRELRPWSAQPIPSDAPRFRF